MSERLLRPPKFWLALRVSDHATEPFSTRRGGDFAGGKDRDDDFAAGGGAGRADEAGAFGYADIIPEQCAVFFGQSQQAVIDGHDVDAAVEDCWCGLGGGREFLAPDDFTVFMVEGENFVMAAGDEDAVVAVGEAAADDGVVFVFGAGVVFPEFITVCVESADFGACVECVDDAVNNNGLCGEGDFIVAAFADIGFPSKGEVSAKGDMLHGVVGVTAILRPELIAP